MTSSIHPDLPDFVALKKRFDDEMTAGQKAELRRAAQPEDLMLKPAFYRLLRGKKQNSQYLRIAFLLPWVEHQSTATHFGIQCAKAKVNEIRLFQIARSDDPADMIQLRRVAMQIKPDVDWVRFGNMLWFWGPLAKRDLIENYYLAQYSVKGTSE
ncbi:MAG: type I-E CRISPR-associated protein Cse2/CasB [Candidatus Contendobacter sp.]|nr:type I-E CRISPR-associated protein Cse2/CasB [Candidatus Contendobacter sp.]MDG4556687.1 type I-E CRISPR-associated protein Cse2/CasB [Candidatus Contendobacter sp.]